MASYINGIDLTVIYFMLSLNNMVRHITLNNEDYYEVYDPITNSVGDITQDWRELPMLRAKLKRQCETKY